MNLLTSDNYALKIMYSNQYLTSVELYRDGIDCPWGFRLKGGIDVDGGTPLEIIRVSLSIKYEPKMGQNSVGSSYPASTKRP